MPESEEELKSLLMNVKEESEKSWLEAQHTESKDHDIWSHHFMANGWGNSGRLYWGAPKSLQMVTAAMKLKDVHSFEEKLWPSQTACSKVETLLCQQRSIYSKLWFYQWSCVDVRVGLWGKLSAEELMLLNCGVGEDSWESLGLQGDPTSPF